MKKPEFILTIPNWEREICIGTVTPKYYNASNKTPEKIKNTYEVKNIMGGWYYVDKKGAPVVKNKKAVGNKKMWAMNGQSFYSNNLHWKTRADIVKNYHKYVTEYIVEKFKEPFPIYLESTLSMHIDIYEVYCSKTPDITNMWILPKLIEDAFVNAKILIEDSPEFRTKTSFEYIFVKSDEERKLVITFKYIDK